MVADDLGVGREEEVGEVPNAMLGVQQGGVKASEVECKAVALNMAGEVESIEQDLAAAGVTGDPVVARVTGALHKATDQNAVLRTYIAKLTKSLEAKDMEVREVRRYGDEGVVSGVVPPIKKELAAAVKTIKASGKEDSSAVLVELVGLRSDVRNLSVAVQALGPRVDTLSLRETSTSSEMLDPFFETPATEASLPLALPGPSRSDNCSRTSVDSAFNPLTPTLSTPRIQAPVGSEVEPNAVRRRTPDSSELLRGVVNPVRLSYPPPSIAAHLYQPALQAHVGAQSAHQSGHQPAHQSGAYLGGGQLEDHVFPAGHSIVSRPGLYLPGAGQNPYTGIDLYQGGAAGGQTEEVIYSLRASR